MGIDFIGVTFGFGFKERREAIDAGAVGCADTSEEILKYIISEE